MRIKVLLADDSEIFRKAIRNVLSMEPQIEIVGEAAGFGQTMEFARRLKPDVVLMDLHMPDMNQISLDKIRTGLRVQGCQIIAISVFSDDNSKAHAKLLGASRLLAKPTLASELLPALLQIAGGMAKKVAG